MFFEKVLDAGNPAMQSSSNRSWAIPPWDIEALEADLTPLCLTWLGRWTQNGVNQHRNPAVCRPAFGAPLVGPSEPLCVGSRDAAVRICARK